MGNTVNIWSVLELYGSEKYEITVSRVGMTDLEIVVYRKYSFGLFGYRMVKRVKNTRFVLRNQDKDFSIFSNYTNSSFDGDQAVNFLSYMRFCEKGFNENPMDDDVLDLLHTVTGMCEEAGEIAGEIKKYVFHSKPYDLTKMVGEAGDYMWYFSNFLRLIGVPMTKVLAGNVEKLNMRYPNGRDKNYLLNKRNKEGENAKIKDVIDNGK
jgi:NTP pyrophosphatase (non-canonical NTP hydrolase)